MTTLVPWLIAASATIGLVVVTIGRDDASSSPSVPAVGCSLEDCTRLRRQIAILENDAGVLRVELDRLGQMLRIKKDSDAHLAKIGLAELSEDEKRKRLKDALERLPHLIADLPKGERETFEALRDANRAMLLAPLDDPKPFRDVYEANSDPNLRIFILPQVVARDREGAKEFLMRELAAEKDPTLRGELVTALNVYVPGAVEDPAVQRLVMDAALEAELPGPARRMAIEAISRVPTADVRSFLFQFATGGDDDAAREAAIRSLAVDPQMRSQLLEAMTQEPDERLRTLGECTARLAALESGELR